ncbi:HNH endonuclease [Corynebacterium macginleyi]|uniref:HNH endonuclease n=1 Tax=Corynebacterium macginleyi TaxID=38290 RepID=UPI001909D660|nr:HNH endonuclease [Corynebacterium macginleyi]
MSTICGQPHQADKQFGIDREYRKKYELVWHHHEEEKRMQLIPKELHQQVRHTGGYALWSKPLES